jgi:hypothetical protein
MLFSALVEVIKRQDELEAQMRKFTDAETL